MRIFRALAPFFLLSASLAIPAVDQTEQFFLHPDRFAPRVQDVFNARGYPAAANALLPRDKPVYVLGQDALAQRVFSQLQAKKGALPLSLANPHHAFSYQYRDSCFVKLTQKTTDKREFLGTWTGIPAAYIENDDVDMDGQELGMALHEIAHCGQDEKAPPVERENASDLKFIDAQRLSGDPNLMRDTMYIRALFVVNDGIRGRGKVYSALDTEYVAALSIDALRHGELPPDPALAAEAYYLLKNHLVNIIGYQTQVAGGFAGDVPEFAKIAMAVNTYIAENRAQPLRDEHHRLALRAAQLYQEGLRHYLPRYAQGLEKSNSGINTVEYVAYNRGPS